MPVTAKLSKLFYDRFGDQIVDELVNWFNLVDATYRSDLREINEHNYARFEAKLEQRLAELDGKFESRLSGVELRVDRRISDLETKMERRFVEQNRWIFASWVTILLTLISMWVRLSRS